MRSQRFSVLTFLLFALVMSVLPAFGQSKQFDITAEKTRLDVERRQTESTSLSAEKWAYKVTTVNRSFKDLSNVEVQYRVYVKTAAVGVQASKQPVKAVPGSKTIGVTLRNGEKFTFDTEPVVLQKRQLTGGWYYADGSRPRTADSIEGIWVRVYKDGQVLAEFSSPTGLQHDQKW